jgi:hypothetical protein
MFGCNTALLVIGTGRATRRGSWYGPVRVRVRVRLEIFDGPVGTRLDPWLPTVLNILSSIHVLCGSLDRFRVSTHLRLPRTTGVHPGVCAP